MKLFVDSSGCLGACVTWSERVAANKEKNFNEGSRRMNAKYEANKYEWFTDSRELVYTS